MFFQHLTSNQGTAVETLRAQLNDATARLNKLTADVHERKSGYGYKHNQLEELRNLQVRSIMEIPTHTYRQVNKCKYRLTFTGRSINTNTDSHLQVGQ